MKKPIHTAAAVAVSIFSSLAFGQLAATAADSGAGEGACKNYVKQVLKLADSGNLKAYERDGANAAEQIADAWLLIDRGDVSELIHDVDRKARVSFQKHNFKEASDRLYCGLDCAAMFGRSLAWGNGHLEGVDMERSKPLVWLDSFAEMNIEVDGLPADKSFSFPKSQYIAAVNNYAYYLQLQGKHAEVIPVFEKIIEMDPERTVAYLNLADSLWATGDKKKAGEKYRQYVCQCRKLHYDGLPGRVQDRYVASAQP
jgi:tetratricopeptide (TPR) repeat protein